MFRTLVLISLLLSSLTLVEGTSAAVTYTPGAMIAMTGSNTGVRFDVASILISEGSTESAPTLVSTTLRFTGTFYGSGIGWIVFASGSSQVSLDCGGQSLSNLTANCTLTGLGWSENIGDIDFAGVSYSPTTGLLSGSAITFAGDISLTGIALPLRAVTLDQTSLVAYHAATLTTRDAWMYDAGNDGWRVSVSIGLDSQSIVGSKGAYTNVDLSLSNDNYTITIIDTNDSLTQIKGFVVNPDTVTTTPTTETIYHADTFCTTNPTDSVNCPDGATRRATTLTQLPITTVIANGSDVYALTLRARDQYGNRVESGTIDVTYATTVKNIQTEDNFNYLFPICADAVNISTFVYACGEWRYTANLNTSDITYTITSTAPTNVDNTIQLESIIYNITDIASLLWKAPLVFDPLFTASVSSLDAPVVNTPHTFQTDVTPDGTTTITPTVITTMQIGDGSAAEWRSLSSSPAAICSNYPLTLTLDPLCDWSGVSSIATSSAIPFAYTGTYTTWLPSAATETTTMTGYIYYNDGTTDILYSLGHPTISAATAATQRMRVLGQSGEGVGGGARTRVDLISDIRQEVALMSRNRSSYDDVDYLVVNGNHTVTATELGGDTGIKAKRTIITLGGDITIADDIDLRDSPIALIALIDAAGNGGNIRIKGDVTDIHSSLIAEHGIISDLSDYQLYIHGSLVSANPPREIPPTGCPYFAPSGCVRSEYDLPGSRADYAALSTTDKVSRQSASGSIYPSPLVIEGDPRIIRDPAPAMSR